MEAMSRPIWGTKTRVSRAARRLRDESGATLIEMTLVITLLITVTFGIIEVALIAWQWNTAEKATYVGVRYAVESDPVAAGFLSYSASVDGGLNPAEDVTVDKIASFAVTCGNTQCVLSDGALPGGFDLSDYDGAAFTAILQRVQRVFPEVAADKLAVEYRHVGLGFADRPGPDLIPAVTVSLVNMSYDVKLMDSFGMPDALPMGGFSATMTGEDLNSGWP